MRVIEQGVADAAPTDDRLDRFRRLAELQFTGEYAFNAWLKKHKLTKKQKETARELFDSLIKDLHVREMFHIIRTTAVFDESFRMPQLAHDEERFAGDVEKKFASLMNVVSLLALTIQREQENHSG